MPPKTPALATLSKEQRRRPRARLSLPVRLRWQTALRQLTEVTQTLEVSRGGLLIHCHEPCGIGAVVWVTFPFDSELLLAQPETLARVARLTPAPTGGYLVALELEETPKYWGLAGARTEAGHPAAGERRRRARIRLALPIRIRLWDSPWPEEAMTVDISDDGARFYTTRLYAVGGIVHVALPPGSFGGRWASTAELRARVTRIEKEPQRNASVWQKVAITLLRAEQP
ncbi:MAG TPA: PilZ domain-containing protein [Candidatus Acidoferrales bacterium]|nr:PilZ domain-containing protein [Candidatus Acidoferrales bacterium]